MCCEKHCQVQHIARPGNGVEWSSFGNAVKWAGLYKAKPPQPSSWQPAPPLLCCICPNCQMYLSKLSNVFVLPPPLLHFAHRSSSSSVYYNFNLQHGYCYRGIVGACSGEKKRLDGPGVAPRNMVTLRWWKVRLLTIEKCRHFLFGWYINANKFANTGPVFQVMILQRNGVQVHPWAGACMHCIALGSLLSNSFTHSSRGKSSREGGTLSKHC